MKNLKGKKIIIGVALLTSLSIFANTTVKNNTEANTQTTVKERVGKRGHKNLDPAKMEEMKAKFEEKKKKLDELKVKFENGTATKEEMKEVAKFLEGKSHRRFGKGPRPEGEKNDSKRENKNLDSAKMEEKKAKFEEMRAKKAELKTKLENGTATKEEMKEVAKILEMKSNRHLEKGKKIENNITQQGNSNKK